METLHDTIIEMYFRCLISVMLIGMWYVVWGNHNPDVLKHQLFHIIMSVSFLIWVFLPIRELIKYRKVAQP